MHFRYNLIINLSICFCILFCFSCGESVEGCLDITAENFDANADKDCCCDYPDLIINFDPIYDLERFSLDKKYPYNSNLDTFIVEEFSLLFSEIHPIQSGEEIETDKLIRIGVNDDLGQETLTVEDNFIVVTPERFSYIVNEFNHPGSFDGIAILNGLTDENRRIIPDSVLVSGHPMTSETDSIWNEDIGYFYLYMKVIPNTVDLEEFKEVVIHGEDITSLNYVGTLNNEVGYDFEIDLQIDYKLLFDGINFEADNENIISQKLKNNLSLSISMMP